MGVGVEVGVEVEVGGVGVGVGLTLLLSRVGGWVGGGCGEVKNRANLSQVRLKLRLSLATVKML